MRLVALIFSVALVGCSPAAVRIEGCPPKVLPPVPEVVSVPAAQCAYALCLDAANLSALEQKLAILKEAVVR